MLFLILVVLGIILIGGSIITSFKKRKKHMKYNTSSYIPVITPPDPEDEDHPNIIIKSEDHALYEKFMQEYDPDGNFKFNDLGYRKGAVNTCPFGISEGFKYDAKGKMQWGYIRLHTGVDRARGGEIRGIKDIVQVPFDFDESGIIEYKKNGKYYGYGTLTMLTNHEYGFQMRVAHMEPEKDIVPWSYNRLKKGQPFKNGWLLGNAGTCGASTGAHTHTEFISVDDSCEVFDILLEEKYGNKVLVEYTKAEILREYRKQRHFKDANDKTILKDWEAVKKHRGAIFVNKYKYSFKNKWGTTFTRYASNLLFNGL